MRVIVVDAMQRAAMVRFDISRDAVNTCFVLQAYPVPFNDDTSVFDTELWDPTSGTFTILSPIGAPRNYHSVGLLLPDARVFCGGGGLCGPTCTCDSLVIVSCRLSASLVHRSPVS